MAVRQRTLHIFAANFQKGDTCMKRRDGLHVMGHRLAKQAFPSLLCLPGPCRLKVHVLLEVTEHVAKGKTANRQRVVGPQNPELGEACELSSKAGA